MPVTMRQICQDALMQIGVYAQGESIDAPDIQLALRRLNDLFDDWNAERCAVYAARFDTYTLPTDTLPVTIGPTEAGGAVLDPPPDWEMDQRPVRIDSAQLIYPNEPNPYLPINIRDAEWWASQPTPTLTSPQPTDLYYQPDYPLGKLFFWPTATTAYQVQLQTRVHLEEVDLTDAFVLPQGYRNAITLTLAEYCVVPFNRLGQVPEALERQAAKARARIFANNDVTPRIGTNDSGMMGPVGGKRADFLWTNGSIV